MKTIPPLVLTDALSSEDGGWCHFSAANQYSLQNDKLSIVSLTSNYLLPYLLKKF